jgi:hypothetical protein
MKGKNMRLEKPYVSVGNVLNADQTLELVSIVPSTHQLGVSCVVTRKHALDAQHTFPQDLFVPGPRLFNIFHCKDQVGGWTLDDLIGVADQTTNGRVHALHLDMTWPKPEAIETFRGLYPDIVLMLQVGGNGMSVDKGDEVHVVDELARYGKMIDIVVFDRRTGQYLDPRRLMAVTTLRRFFGHIQRNLDIRLALVEELHEYSLDSVLSLFKDFPSLSLHIEAGGGKERKNNQPLDVEKVKKFFKEAFPVIKRYNATVSA